MIAAQPQPPAVNIKALSWTIAVHALLLLLFFIWRYTIPTMVAATADAGSGMEVNLGSSADGSGNDQPQSKEKPSAYSAAVVYKNADVKSSLPKDIVRTDGPDATALNDPNKAKNVKTDNQPKNNTPVTPMVPKSVYAGDNSGKGGNDAKNNVKGSSEGKTTGPGDQGVAGGTPGAANYTGAPGTGGIGHTLTGRDINPKKVEAEFREGGKVVIHVTVDRDGNIVSKLVKTSSNPELTKIALDKLSKAKFSKSTSTEPQQFGDVTIVFKAR